MTICKDVELQLGQMVDGLLPDAAAQATVRAHLEQCAACRGVLQDLERWHDARTVYQALHNEDPAAVEHLGALGVLSARLGRIAEADSIAARLVADARAWQFGAPRLWAGRIAAVKGDREAAIALIHQALREGYARLYLLHTEHDFETLRDSPAFREILEPRSAGSR